jgi:hypothetical protein
MANKQEFETNKHFHDYVVTNRLLTKLFYTGR